MFKKLEINEERDLGHLVVHDPESIESRVCETPPSYAANRRITGG
ncbi:MAG TPA: hypothetical protein VL486_09560 [Verrucomicrobiae bacterium]|nr:hypothetical protein [Verrucomicrobiae bacterium]